MSTAAPLLFQRRAEALLFHLLQGVEGGGEGARGLVPSRDGAVPGVSFVLTFERVENSLICKFIYIIKIQGRVSRAIVTTSHYEQRRGKKFVQEGGGNLSNVPSSLNTSLPML